MINTKNYRHMVMSMALVSASCSVAFGQSTFTFGGTIGHVDSPGDPDNTIVVAGGIVGASYTISNTITNLTNSTLTKVATADYLSDNGFTIRNSALPGLSATGRYNATGEIYTSYLFPNGATRVISGSLIGAVAPSGSSWTVEFWNDFNDGTLGISEANISGLSFRLDGLSTPSFTGINAGASNSVDQPYDLNNVIVNVGTVVTSFVLGPNVQVSAILNDLVPTASGDNAVLRITCSAFPGEYAQVVAGGGLYLAPYALSGVATANGGLIGRTIPAGSNISVEFCEDTDDSSGPSSVDNNGIAEQSWTNLNLKLFGEPYTVPSPPPSTLIGTINPGDSFTVNSNGFVAGEVKWYRIILAQDFDTSANEFLDIYSQAKGIAAGDLADTEMAFYNANGVMITQDDDDDTRWMSAFSFGVGPETPRNGNTAPVGAIGWSNGKDFNGRDGNSLKAGTYYIALSVFPGTFGHKFSAVGGSNASTNGCNLKIRSNGGGSVISGNVNLQDWIIDEAGELVNFSLLNSAGIEVQTGKVTLGAVGTYSLLASVPNGTYTLVLKGRHWLAQGIEGIAINGSSLTRNFSLVNGDVNNDNFVGFDDFDQLSASFGQASGDPGFDTDADLNGDDFNGFDDFDILSAHFGESGYGG